MLAPLDPLPEEHQPDVSVLLERAGSAPETDWSARPGVLDVRTDDERVRLTVRIDHRDALLLAALEQGWSVLSVTGREGSR